ncbi:unnamed protein product, partial [Ectocarpus sp. 12 AP-2014]
PQQLGCLRRSCPIEKHWASTAPWRSNHGGKSTTAAICPFTSPVVKIIRSFVQPCVYVSLRPSLWHHNTLLEWGMRVRFGRRVNHCSFDHGTLLAACHPSWIWWLLPC